MAWFERQLGVRGHHVSGAGDLAMFERILQLRRFDVVFADSLSFRARNGALSIAGCQGAGTPVVLMREHFTGTEAFADIQGGAYDVLQRPLRASDVLGVLASIEAEGRRDRFAEQTEEDVRLGPIVTRSASVKSLFDVIRTAAPTNVNVLVLGENGSGKELVASLIHDLSQRRNRPFVRINCAALPDELLESELFGHRRGSFTGAESDRVGLLAHAHGGSVLLDEIAEMSASLQAKLLRVLQDKQVRPVGDTRMMQVDFRLVCATNVNPQKAMSEGRLREDLFFRINTVTIRMPPLRERPADIPLLAHLFLKKFTRLHGRAVDGFHPATLRTLVSHPWPGNVRELEHAVESAVIIAQGRQIGVLDLPDHVRHRCVRVDDQLLSLPASCSLDELERLAILQALADTDGNKRAAAKMLGIHRPTLYSKLRKHQLDSPRKTSRAA